MSIIAPNVFGSPLNFSAESSAMVRRFHTENTTPSDTRDIGVVCNEDNDCPMGNLCIQGQCYVHCDSEGNDCPFWHTCLNLHRHKAQVPRAMCSTIARRQPQPRYLSPLA